MKKTATLRPFIRIFFISLFVCLFMSRITTFAASTSFKTLPTKLSLYSSQQYEVFKVNTSTKKLTMTSSNPSVVKVITRTYIVGKAPGTATLTVKDAATGKTKKITVTVRKMKVLFVGASLTGRAYDNDRNVNYPTTRYVLPNMYKALMQKQGYSLDISVAIKGYNKSFLGTQLEFYNKYYSVINRGYDIAVLNVLPPVTFAERLTKNQDVKGLQKIIPLLIKNNPKVRIYFHHAWSYEKSSKTTFIRDFNGIDAEAAALSKQFKHKIYIIHDGEAMYYASRRGVKVYSKIDGIHASLKGMYLTNYCVATSLMEPNADPNVFHYTGGYGGVYLSKKDADYFKSIAKMYCYKK